MALNEIIQNWASTLFTIVIVVSIYYGVKYVLDKQIRGKTDKALIRSIILFVIGLGGIIIIVLSVPMSVNVKGQIINLIGIVISAVIALSSATLFGNALAGIMLRIVNNYKSGDYIIIKDIGGRVTERGLFHTEIQTETTDLMTLPNMFLANNPVKVIRASGTLIEGEVSLGYDINQNKIKKALIEAGENAGLEEPFVRVEKLGDFSIIYKVFGLLKDAKTVLTARSKLNSAMLDALHGAGIEIVSPTVMNQRRVDDVVFIPKVSEKIEEIKEDVKVEEKIFDIAQAAEKLEERKEALSLIEDKISEKESALKTSDNKNEINQLTEEINKLKQSRDVMLENIEKRVENIHNK